MRTKAEENFIDQYTRSLLVRWGDALIRSTTPAMHPVIGGADEPYTQHAINKGWVTKREPRRLTSKGWSTAASFLKR